MHNFSVYFKGDILVKMSSWYCGWIESAFYVHLLFILHNLLPGMLPSYYYVVGLSSSSSS